MKKIRTRLTFANVIACLALFVSLGGASYAATQLPKNSVGSKQIKKNAVTKAKIRKNAITAAKVKADSLTGTQINESKLGTVPSAASAATASDAQALGGLPPTAFLPSSGVRADGFASAEPIAGFNSKEFAEIGSKSFTAPSAGFIYLTGSVSTEVTGAPPARGELFFRLTLDGESLEETDIGHGIATNEEAGVFTGSGSTTVVVPVSAGSHTVAMEAWEAQQSEDIGSRAISILFVPNGSASSFPLPK